MFNIKQLTLIVLFSGISFGNVLAKDIAGRTITADIVAYSSPGNPTSKEVWNQLWGKAYHVCKRDFNDTKSVRLRTFYVNNTNYRTVNVTSLWTCRDNP